jgi:hypothetical protein
MGGGMPPEIKRILSAVHDSLMSIWYGKRRRDASRNFIDGRSSPFPDRQLTGASNAKDHHGFMGGSGSNGVVDAGGLG